MNEINNSNDKIRKKIIRSSFGLRGFVICLTSGITALAAQVPLAAYEHFIGSSFSLASLLLGLLTALLILGALVFFSVLISGLLMAPRDIDIRPDLEKILPELVRIMAWAMGIFVVLVLCTIIIILSAAYVKSHSHLLGAIILLCGSMLLFALSTAYALVKTFSVQSAGQSMSSRIASIIIRRKSDVGSAGRFMGKLEWGFVSMLSVMLYLLFEGDKLLSLVSPLIGEKNVSTAERIITGKDAVLHIMPFIILVFAMAFALKGIRTIYDTIRM